MKAHIPLPAAWIGCLALVLAIAHPLVVQSNTMDIQLGPTCVTSDCHGNIMEEAHLHGPVNLGQCETCHITVGNQHVFEPIQVGPGLCSMCHDVEPQKKVVHGPYQSDCTQCHDPHGADNRRFLIGGGGVQSCNLCHDDVAANKSHLHGPVALGECLVCHTPHESDHAGLLIEPRRDLCLGCHIDIEIQMANALYIHEPVDLTCSGCHDPHGGNIEYFLPKEGSDLCMTCHSDFIHAALEAEFPHAPMTEDKACRNCHAPHASPQEALLSTSTKELCLTCHSETIHRDGRSINNIHLEITQASSLHGPIREDNCVACHMAHGSDVAQILRKPYPKDFYAPFEPGAYDLCFECHDRAIVDYERTDATGFRDGDRNLHFLHVSREKGRTCRACHAEHASTQPNHVRTEVPFGRWMMPVKFEKTETGGTCETGCHIPYEYDRVSPALEPQ